MKQEGTESQQGTAKTRKRHVTKSGKNKTEGQVCKKYSVWNNCRYVFRHLRQKEGAKAVGICGVDAVLSVLQPFLETALAGAAAACLMSGRTPEEILLLVLGYVVLLQAVRLLQREVKALRMKSLFCFRIDMGMDLFRKTLEMDGQCRESGLGQKKYEAAQRNLYMGNNMGIEAYARCFCDLLLQMMGLTVYGIIVGKASLLLLLLLTVLTLMVSFLHTKAGKRAYAMEDEIEKNWGTFQYLRRESIISGNGKDIRLYRMDRWFLKLFHKMIDRVCVLMDRQQTGYTAAGIAEDLLTFIRNVIVYGWLIREIGMGNMTLPAFLLYVGVVAEYGSWLNGLVDAWQGIMENERLMDAYRDFMDFGVVEEGKPADRKSVV